MPPRKPSPVDDLAWSDAVVSRFRSRLLDFFDECARDLPWRSPSHSQPNPYRVLVSEVMLQQTRVDTAIPYFRAWMARFPSAEVLAEADVDEVLSVWQGLGYYSRARNLHRAAREVVTRYGGTMPENPTELESLPGIGPYTAGAVASIAFGVPAPAVDGNVRRVLSRLMDAPEPKPATLRRWAASLVDPERPGTFNQAMMELGALVCTPRSPQCPRCPVAPHCAARAEGTQEERPAPPPKREIPKVEEAVAILVASNASEPRVLLRRRAERGLLGGMWELPGRAVGRADQPVEVARALALDLLARLRPRLEPAPTDTREAHPFRGAPEPLSSLDHAFSHRRVRYIPFRFRLAVTPNRAGTRAGEGELRWTAARGLQDLAIPAAQRRLLSRAGI